MWSSSSQAVSNEKWCSLLQAPYMFPVNQLHSRIGPNILNISWIQSCSLILCPEHLTVSCHETSNLKPTVNLLKMFCVNHCVAGLGFGAKYSFICFPEIVLEYFWYISSFDENYGAGCQRVHKCNKRIGYHKHMDPGGKHRFPWLWFLSFKFIMYFDRSYPSLLWSKGGYKQAN